MRRRALGVVGVVSALSALLLLPSPPAAGEEEERPKVVSFQVKASNGYTMLVLAEEP